MSEEYTFKSNQETIEKVRKEFDLDEKKIKEAVEGIKNWLELQPHLPNVEDDERLERWLIRCKNNMEKLKQAIDMYYSIRTTCPEFMSGWDVNDPWFDTVRSYGYCFIMPETTLEYDRISLLGLRHSDHQHCNFLDVLKIIILLLEIRMYEDYFLKEICIINLKHVTVSHMTKVSISAIGKVIKCVLKAYCWRMRGIHIVNAPPYAENIINLAKGFVSNKMAQRVHVYGADFTELYKHVPKSLLPTELGGDSGPAIEISDRLAQKMKDYRDLFLRQEKLKADESKRPSDQTNCGAMFGIDGSFRTLSID